MWQAVCLPEFWTIQEDSRMSNKIDLKKEGESVEDAKKRLTEEQKEREETAKEVGKPNIPQQ